MKESLSENLFAPIEIAVLDGFGDKGSRDIRVSLKVGNGPGNLQDPVIGPRGQTQLVDGGFQQGVGGLIRPAVLFDMAAAHLGIAINFGAGKPFGLALTGRVDPLSDPGGRLGRMAALQVFVGNRRDFHMNVDPINQRTGDF